MTEHVHLDVETEREKEPEDPQLEMPTSLKTSLEPFMYVFESSPNDDRNVQSGTTAAVVTSQSPETDVEPSIEGAKPSVDFPSSQLLSEDAPVELESTWPLSREPLHPRKREDRVESEGSLDLMCALCEDSDALEEESECPEDLSTGRRSGDAEAISDKVSASVRPTRDVADADHSRSLPSVREGSPLPVSSLLYSTEIRTYLSPGENPSANACGPCKDCHGDDVEDHAKIFTISGSLEPKPTTFCCPDNGETGSSYHMELPRCMDVAGNGTDEVRCPNEENEAKISAKCPSCQTYPSSTTLVLGSRESSTCVPSSCDHGNEANASESSFVVRDNDLEEFKGCHGLHLDPQLLDHVLGGPHGKTSLQHDDQHGEKQAGARSSSLAADHHERKHRWKNCRYAEKAFFRNSAHGEHTEDQSQGRNSREVSVCFLTPCPGCSHCSTSHSHSHEASTTNSCSAAVLRDHDRSHVKILRSPLRNSHEIRIVASPVRNRSGMTSLTKVISIRDETGGSVRLRDHAKSSSSSPSRETTLERISLVLARAIEQEMERGRARNAAMGNAGDSDGSDETSRAVTSFSDHDVRVEIEGVRGDRHSGSTTLTHTPSARSLLDIGPVAEVTCDFGGVSLPDYSADDPQASSSPPSYRIVIAEKKHEEKRAVRKATLISFVIAAVIVVSVILIVSFQAETAPSST